MQILHLISSLNPAHGGPTESTTGLAIAQQNAGARVRIVSTHNTKTPPTTERLHAAGVGMRFVGPTTGKLVSHPNLQKVLREEIATSDIVVIHAMWEDIQYFGAVICRELKVPFIIKPHGMLTPWSLAQGRLKKSLYVKLRLKQNLRACAAFQFTAVRERELTGIFKKKHGLQATDIVEPVGVDLSRFRVEGDHRELRNKPSLRDLDLGDRPVVIFLGRIHPGKGLEYLVPAMAYVEPKKAVLLVVGGDSNGYKKHIVGLVEKSNVTDRVIFAGIRFGQDLADTLGCADIFCLPSDHENFGISIIESLAAGTPVVISHEVAIVDDIVNAGAGSAVDRVPQVIGKELSRWLADESLRKTAADKGKALAKERFDWSKIAVRVLSQYAQVIHTYKSSNR